MEHVEYTSGALAELKSTDPAGGLGSDRELAAPAKGTEPLGKLVGLDLGTDSGVCVKAPGTPLCSWTLCLASDDELEQQRRDGKERTLDVRFTRLFNFAREQIQSGARGFVIEDVGFVSTRMQTQLWASLRSAIWAAVMLHPGVQMYCVPVATLKEFATGSSTAHKGEMSQALATRRPQDYTLLHGTIRKADGTVADHNEVDAIWLALYAEAVERGERAFLSVYQRKQRKAAERRGKKALRKQKAKRQKTLQLAQQKAKNQAIRSALKALGPCCGVFRRRDRSWAICPKCHTRVAIPKIRVPSLSDTDSSAPVSRASVDSPREPVKHWSTKAGSENSVQIQDQTAESPRAGSNGAADFAAV